MVGTLEGRDHKTTISSTLYVYVILFSFEIDVHEGGYFLVNKRKPFFVFTVYIVRAIEQRPYIAFKYGNWSQIEFELAAL